MVKIIILTVGALDQKHWLVPASEYLARLKQKANIVFISLPEVKDNSILVKTRTESQKINNQLEKYKDYQQFLLDLSGKLISSEDFAQILDQNMGIHRGKLLFIIGGSNGVDETIKNNTKIKSLAFSKLTFPHQLCQVILLEQIYRSFQILANTPYHK